MDRNSCDETKPRSVRKIKPTKRSVSGVFPFQGESGIPYESMLERDFLFRTEISSEVLEIIPQPVMIPFQKTAGPTRIPLTFSCITGSVIAITRIIPNQCLSR
ncbi:hypothetical protein PS938_00601 [Pseudomonas fluorescens]|uniref:Uncharacterized protein n=1 Tax=Pseudomonas fluorescens TaxID=294 RepID=A0A5E7S057_PSEFL|nr:hypothetical protein PS938_00601 [Pseudomonas fluorescens]